MHEIPPPQPTKPPIDDSSAVAARAKREKVRRWLNGLLERHRHEADQLQLVTRFCLEVEAWPELARTCDLLLALDPCCAEAHRLKAMAVLADADAAGTDRQAARRIAVTELRAALRLAPTHLSALADLAALHLRDRHPRAALPLLEQAIREQPLLAPLHFNLALAHAQLRQFDRGIAALRFAIRLDPGNARCHAKLACILGESDRFAAAIDECRRALAIEPCDHPTRHNLGEFQYHLGHLAEAEASLRLALSMVEHPQTLFFLAATLARAGRGQEAEEIAARLKTIDPVLAHQLQRIMRIAMAADHATKPRERSAPARSGMRATADRVVVGSAS